MIHRRYDQGERLDAAGLNEITVLSDHSRTARTEIGLNSWALGGDAPSAIEPPGGCHFHPRWPIAADRCKTETPEWRQMDDVLWVACHKA
jgi:oligopeptide/dipeptide ABC transporter ATP-binding protein